MTTGMMQKGIIVSIISVFGHLSVFMLFFLCILSDSFCPLLFAYMGAFRDIYCCFPSLFMLCF